MRATTARASKVDIPGLAQRRPMRRRNGTLPHAPGEVLPGPCVDRGPVHRVAAVLPGLLFLGADRATVRWKLFRSSISELAIMMTLSPWVIVALPWAH